MGLKTLPFRDIEDQADNLYEAVAAMSGQARNELQEQILNKKISSHNDEELDVFDEVEEYERRSAADPEMWVACLLKQQLRPSWQRQFDREEDQRIGI